MVNGLISDYRSAKLSPSKTKTKGPTRQPNVSQPAPDDEEAENEDDWIHEDVQLSDEQKHIVGEVLKGRNVFFTGSAGGWRHIPISVADAHGLL